MAACDGDTASPSATAAPTQQATEPAQAAAPTQAPPTEAPTEAPAEPTSPPEPTAALPTAAPTEAAAISLGECDNPFFPVAEGLSYRYVNIFPGSDATEFVMTYSDVTESSFTTTSTFDDGEFLQQIWRCSDEGLLSPELTQLPGGMEGIEIEYVEASGVSIPPADQMQPGGTWTAHYVANATMGDSSGEAMTMVETIDLVNTVAGIESITVPAGTYEAVRVDTAGTVNIAMTINGETQPGNDVPMNYTSWYVEGIGLVRQEFSGLFSDAADSSIVTELVAIED